MSRREQRLAGAGTERMARTSPTMGLTGGLMSIVLAACATLPGQDGARPAATAERELIDVKARIMSADFRADLVELGELRDLSVAFAGDAKLGHLANYWAGFASWRLAMNGYNRQLDAADLRGHLERAAAALEAAMRERGDFADAYAAAASVNGWLASYRRDDPEALRDLVARSRQQLARAKELAPTNPRVLWVESLSLSASSAAKPENGERAMQVLQNALEVSDFRARPDSPLPDWGRAEILMALAWGHLHSAQPDLTAAEEQARAALKLHPEWFYVRELLVPQIRYAAHKASGVVHDR